MRNKYSELSDAEIEHLIAEKRNGRVIDRINRDVFVSKICSRYEDAFKLMIDNEINLSFNPLIPSWIAEVHYNYDVTTFNEKPCRAIAECYLLMKNAENNNDK